MTLILETESHGEVEAGFYGSFTQFARFGKHTFATKHLCELVQYFARNPNKYRAQIVGYDLDKFWQRQGDYAEEVAQIFVEAEKSYLPELKRFELDRHLEMQLDGLSLEDDVDLCSEGTIVPVEITREERFIQVGDYEVEDIYFGRMAFYLARGGWFGWGDVGVPEFAGPTIESIKNSRRDFYRGIREEILLGS